MSVDTCVCTYVCAFHVCQRSVDTCVCMYVCAFHECAK